MEKISRASSSMDEEEYGFLEEAVVVIVEEDEEYDLGLSLWEFIDASDVDSQEDRHFFEEEQEEEDRVQGVSEASGSLSFHSSIPLTVPNNGHDRIDGCVDVHHLLPVLDLKPSENYDEDEGVDDGYDDYEDQDDDDDDGYDLNDELVPWSVSEKVGRQRMRKLGKRAFPKMNNSKRSPYLFVRPGCVRGKHGLGLKHSC